MEITCPKCSKGTNFNVTDIISCSHCQASFESLKLVKKAMIGTVTALMIGGIAGHKIDDLLEPSRYPIATEYALVEQCVKGRKESLYVSNAKVKFAICTCALTKAQKHYDFKAHNNTPDAFQASMNASATNCFAEMQKAQGGAN